MLTVGVRPITLVMGMIMVELRGNDLVPAGVGGGTGGKRLVDRLRDPTTTRGFLYGLALKTPLAVVEQVTAMLTRYHQRGEGCDDAVP